MSLKLELGVENAALSTHESVRLVCRLRNEGTGQLEIPGPYDRSGAFKIRLLDPVESPIREMDRRTRQVVMSTARVDASLQLQRLDPGQEWEWYMDLSSFGYPFPPGQFLLEATYQYPPSALSLRAGPQPLVVSGDPVQRVTALRDNPILDGVALLFEVYGQSGPEYYLRLHNYSRPFGAWFSGRVFAGHRPAVPFVASTNFYQTASTDPFFEKWVLGVIDEVLVARLYSRGRFTGQVRSARLPEGSTVVRSAFRDAAGNLFVFLWSAEGQLECHRLDGASMRKEFEHKLLVPPGTPLSIGADEESIHIAMPWRGVLYERLTHRGRRLEQLHLVRSRLTPLSISYEPGAKRIKAILRDGVHGKSFHFAAIDFKKDVLSECYIERLPIRDDVHEIAFDQDKKGRYHVLFSTSAGRLYYYADSRTPLLVADTEVNYFPVVASPLQVYLGYNRRECGYRFVQYQKRRRGRKFVELETRPQE